MRETILVVGHGSRDEEGNVEVEEFCQYWQGKHPDWRIEVCWIEHARVLPDAGLNRAANNSDRVIILPLILNAAGHVKMELPEYVQQARLRFPQVQFLLGRHLGVDERILKLLRMRIHGAMVGLDMPDPKNTGILLLGRGSSDMAANGEVAKMARWIFETTRHDLVDYAFSGITDPRLETMVARQVAVGAMQIIVVPYYLFTGRLIKRIQKQVERLTRQYPQMAFALAGYLGINDRVVEVLESRLAEVREQSVSMMECDGCRFREMAREHEADHHRGCKPGAS
ncbi:MAG: Cobalamin biosynthesis protein CbiX [Magnetococcales bacterium]|nr:Cobalamin biosynthesis protein CbiX [Magnetococcales bacterium]HIJ82775.1 sirohydrochlorin chelatase [Magnetococcales bacterium]